MLSLPLPTDTVLIIAVKAFGEERGEGGKGKELSDLSKFMQQALVTLYLPPHHRLQAVQEGDVLSLGGEELSVPWPIWTAGAKRSWPYVACAFRFVIRLAKSHHAALCPGQPQQAQREDLGISSDTRTRPTTQSSREFACTQLPLGTFCIYWASPYLQTLMQKCSDSLAFVPELTHLGISYFTIHGLFPERVPAACWLWQGPLLLAGVHLGCSAFLSKAI